MASESTTAEDRTTAPPDPTGKPWFEPVSLQEAEWFAEKISRSSFCPDNFRGKPGDVFVVLVLAAELKIGAMTALQGVAVINGKPSVYGDLALAMVQSSGKLEEFEEDGPEVVLKQGFGRCKMKRRGDKTAREYRYSIEMAKTAGLWEKRGKEGQPTPWVTHPGRMLQLKPRNFLMRDLFSDVLKGLSLREEAEEYEVVGRTPDGHDIMVPRAKAEEKRAAAEAKSAAPPPEPLALKEPDAPLDFGTKKERETVPVKTEKAAGGKNGSGTEEAKQKPTPEDQPAKAEASGPSGDASPAAASPSAATKTSKASQEQQPEAPASFTKAPQTAPAEAGRLFKASAGQAPQTAAQREPGGDDDEPAAPTPYKEWQVVEAREKPVAGQKSTFWLKVSRGELMGWASTEDRTMFLVGEYAIKSKTTVTAHVLMGDSGWRLIGIRPVTPD